LSVSKASVEVMRRAARAVGWFGASERKARRRQM
jgi:hypothetical protein